MNLSVIIPWYNRKEIKKTLKTNSPLFKEFDIEVIVVNCGGRLDLLNVVIPPGESYKIVDIPEVKFNKSLALNVGSNVASKAYLFFLDADIILNRDFFLELNNQLNELSFTTIKNVYESKQKKNVTKTNLEEIAYYIEITDSQQNRVQVETKRVNLNTGSRSAPGLVILSKLNFIKIEGMNSELEGWGWEDNDLLFRLQIVLNLQWVKIGKCKHLTHSNKVRFTNGLSLAESESTNFGKCITNYSNSQYFGTLKKDILTAY